LLLGNAAIGAKGQGQAQMFSISNQFDKKHRLLEYDDFKPLIFH